MGVKEEIIGMLNEALELEHAAYIQYLSHAEIPDGMGSEKIIERLKEIAEDEKEHAETFRELIGAYMGGVPSMGMDKTRSANSINEILEINLEDEKRAVDVYTGMLSKLVANRDKLPYEFLKLEHEVRHVIMDEQEHISEIKQLMGK